MACIKTHLFRKALLYESREFGKLPRSPMGIEKLHHTRRRRNKTFCEIRSPARESSRAFSISNRCCAYERNAPNCRSSFFKRIYSPFGTLTLVLDTVLIAKIVSQKTRYANRPQGCSPRGRFFYILYSRFYILTSMSSQPRRSDGLALPEAKTQRLALLRGMSP